MAERFEADVRGTILPSGRESAEGNKSILDNISAAAEAAGRVSILKVPNDANRYVIHVGQEHRFPAFLDNRLSVLDNLETYSTGRVKSQVEIEKFLLGLQRNDPNVKAVYVEGYTDEQKPYLRQVREMAKMFESDPLYQPANPHAADNLLNFYHHTLKNLIDLPPNSDPQFVLDYLTSKKIAEIQGCTRPAPADEETEQSAAELSGLETFIGDNWKGFEREDPRFMKGAAMKMMLDGKIDIQPAGKKETFEAVKGGFGRKDGPNHNKKLVAEVVLKKREEDAVAIVGKSGVFSRQSCAPLIFGDGHDFSASIKDFNINNPSASIGLVEVKDN